MTGSVITARPRFTHSGSSLPLGSSNARSRTADGMSSRPSKSNRLAVSMVVREGVAMSSMDASIATTATTAASANRPASVRTSRARATRSRSTGSSAAIGAAT